MAQYTLSHSEKSKGWTSFWSYIPELMLKLNNRFYSIKNGQLHLHNEDIGDSNTFYGVKYPSKVKMVFNELGSEDKIFKTIVLEGNRPWDVAVATNLANSTIKSTEFQLKESRYFAHTRKNENENDFHGNTVQGIGVIQNVNGWEITFNAVSHFVSTGDVLYQLNGTVNEVIGIIELIEGNVITVSAITTIPLQGLYSFSKKNARIEGSEIRGYYMEVELTNNDSEQAELFAVNTNAARSGITLNNK
jgi:hypothetical protein